MSPFAPSSCSDCHRLISPFMQDFVDSGGFSFCEKMKASLRINLLFYTCAGVAGGGLLIFVAVTQHLGFSEVMKVAISLGNAFGLVLLLLMLGYGLVDVPRKIWRLANKPVLLLQYQFEGSEILERKAKAEQELKDTIEAIHKAKNQLFSRNLEPFMDIVLQKVCLSNYLYILHHAHIEPYMLCHFCVIDSAVPRS